METSKINTIERAKIYRNSPLLAEQYEARGFINGYKAAKQVPTRQETIDHIICILNRHSMILGGSYALYLQNSFDINRMGDIDMIYLGWARNYKVIKVINDIDWFSEIPEIKQVAKNNKLKSADNGIFSVTIKFHSKETPTDQIIIDFLECTTTINSKHIINMLTDNHYSINLLNSSMIWYFKLKYALKGIQKHQNDIVRNNPPELQDWSKIFVSTNLEFPIKEDSRL